MYTSYLIFFEYETALRSFLYLEHYFETQSSQIGRCFFSDSSYFKRWYQCVNVLYVCDAVRPELRPESLVIVVDRLDWWVSISMYSQTILILFGKVLLTWFLAVSWITALRKFNFELELPIPFIKIYFILLLNGMRFSKGFFYCNFYCNIYLD